MQLLVHASIEDDNYMDKKTIGSIKHLKIRSKPNKTFLYKNKSYHDINKI